MTLTEKDFRRWRAELFRKELMQPLQWHYVSFAESVFKGAVVIQAHGVVDATQQCHMLDINPGGQVMCMPMPDAMVAQVPEADRMRLLSKADVERIWPDAMSLGEHEELDKRGVV